MVLTIKTYKNYSLLENHKILEKKLILYHKQYLKSSIKPYPN
jgi:hypothetical protein